MFDDHEARVNLVTSLFLRDMLLKHTVNLIVAMTRIEDKTVSLGTRLEMVNDMNPDAFVSIHCNSFHDRQAHGFEVIYGDNYDVKLAEYILLRMESKLPQMRSRGIKHDDEWLKYEIAVLKNMKVPCVLVEMGFISNPDDYLQLVDHRQMAYAIANGIINYSEYVKIEGHPV